jgi:hypothetical protein
MTTGASPIKDCPKAAFANFFLVSLFLTTINFQSCRLLAEGESLAATIVENPQDKTTHWT